MWTGRLAGRSAGRRVHYCLRQGYMVIVSKHSFVDCVKCITHYTAGRNGQTGKQVDWQVGRHVVDRQVGRHVVDRQVIARLVGRHAGI